MEFLNPIRWLFAMMWMAIGPSYFGGSSKSSTATTTQNWDNRAVTTNTTSNLDLSNRSIDSSTTNTNTNISTTTNTLDGGAIGAMKDVALNGLAFGDSLFDTATLFANNALNSSLQASSKAYDIASGLQQDALLGARSAFEFSSRATSDAYLNASKATTDAYKNSDKSTKEAYATALTGAAAAYADAKGTTNSQKSIIMGVLAVAGIMGLAVMQKRG